MKQGRIFPLTLVFLAWLLGLLPAGLASAQTFTNLHSFNSNSDGASPFDGLFLSGNTLYGTTIQGGSNGNGTVFSINTDGSGFTNLHSFNGSDGVKETLNKA